MQKVSDGEILAAVWKAQLYRIAKSSVLRNEGGRLLLPLYGCDLGSRLRLTERRKLGIELNNTRLSVRLEVLIESGQLVMVDECTATYSMPDKRLDEAFRYATDYWRALGVPEGESHDKRRVRAVKVDGFDEKLDALKAQLTAKFPFRRVLQL